MPRKSNAVPVPSTRRKFLKSAGAVAAAALLPAASGAADDTLALHGGTKAVRERLPRHIRWGEPERERLNAILGQDSLFYWKGPQTTMLTERFRRTYPLKYVMPCSSGTAALHIAVAAAGIGPGDEVITTPVTDIGTVVGILFQQAVPVFADLERNTYNLDLADVARRITPKTKAIIAVHLLGNPCDLNGLKTLADKHGLVLIEDCAQAWGARYAGTPIGTIGHIACFSFQDSKQVTCGDGGLVASRDERFGPLLQRYGDKGIDRSGNGRLFEHFATNYRMSEPQAAIAAAQLTRLEKIAATRSRLGNLLTEQIGGLPGIEPLNVRREDRCTYWFHMLRLQPRALKCGRDEFAKALVAEGVPAAPGYPLRLPLYGHPMFQKHNFFAGRWPVKDMGLTTIDYTKARCPEAEAFLATGVRVVIHEGMSEEYVSSVASAVRKVARHYAA